MASALLGFLETKYIRTTTALARYHMPGLADCDGLALACSMAYLLTRYTSQDIQSLFAQAQDPRVMEFFPGLGTYEWASTFVERQQKQFAQHKTCYWAVRKNGSNNDNLVTLNTSLHAAKSLPYLGFVGVIHNTVAGVKENYWDIGWRLAPALWGKGITVPAAQAAMQHIQDMHPDARFHAVITDTNQPSIQVATRLGMKRSQSFQHPMLLKHPELVNCGMWSTNT